MAGKRSPRALFWGSRVGAHLNRDANCYTHAARVNRIGHAASRVLRSRCRYARHGQHSRQLQAFCRSRSAGRSSIPGRAKSNRKAIWSNLPCTGICSRWDPDAEKLHGISLEQLLAQGRPPLEVARRMKDSRFRKRRLATACFGFLKRNNKTADGNPRDIKEK